MIIKVDTYSANQGIPLPIRCPKCRRDGSFKTFTVPDVVVGKGGTSGLLQLWLGQRQCPNRECNTHVFVVWHVPQKVLATYPAQGIDFNSTDIPATVVAPFAEALRCESVGCFVAAGMLVRKTLEQMCEERGASGTDLKKRIEALREKVILPVALLDAADELRLLGNDAAHIESKTYNSVGSDEVAAAILLTREILKSVYQYDALLGRLRALKK